jgi:uncharacterized protein involved in exopolysaccharide biosynthesis
MTGIQASAGYDPYFIQTEFEKMQGEKVLGRVIDALDLNDVWGKKLNGGVQLKTADTMQLLKQHMSLSPERNTKLIDITVYSEDKQEAADLANGIAQAYQEYRLALRNTNTTGGIAAYVEEYRTEETQIPAIQTNLDRLRQELDIIDTDPQSTAPSPTLSQQQLQHYKEQQIEQEKDYMEKQTQLAGLQSLQATNPAELRDVIPTMYSDTQLGDSLSRLHQTEQSLAELKVDYSTNYPDVMRQQKLADELNIEIEARIKGIMDGMATQVKSLKDGLDAQTAIVDDAIKKDQEEAKRSQPYWELKLKLENAREFHKLLQTKIATE